MSDEPSPKVPGSGGGRRKFGAVEWILLVGLLGFAVYGLFFSNPAPC